MSLLLIFLNKVSTKILRKKKSQGQISLHLLNHLENVLEINKKIFKDFLEHRGPQIILVNPTTFMYFNFIFNF